MNHGKILHFAFGRKPQRGDLSGFPMTNTHHPGQSSTEENARSRSREGSKTNRLDVFPRNNVLKKIGRYFARPEPEQAAHDHPGDGAAGNSNENFWPSHRRISQ